MLHIFWLWLAMAPQYLLGKSTNNVELLAGRLEGVWTSTEQSVSTDGFADVTVTYCPVVFDTETSSNAVYLYYEQALTRSLDAPYRKGFTKITQSSDGSLFSTNTEIAEEITESLCLNEGIALLPVSYLGDPKCAIRLFARNQVFSGGTDPEGCPNSFRGATFVTNEVAIFESEMITWDRGWNDRGEQVWGSEIGPYIFRKE